MKMKGLGKGLEALLGDTMADISQDEQALADVDINLIDPNPNQPRRSFDKDKLKELADSIAAVGVISPIIVYKNGNRYTIIAGERRYRASRMAGLSTIPAVIRDYDEIRRAEVALIENLQRDDLNPIEEAMGIHGLIEQCAYTQERAAERLGKSRPAIANALRLLSLDDKIKDDVKNGVLSAGHARALLAVEDVKLRQEIAKKAAEEGWSVRKIEQYIKELGKQEKPKNKLSDAELDQVGEQFKKMFGLKVSFSGDRNKGRITLHYSSFEELERIYDLIKQED